MGKSRNTQRTKGNQQPSSSSKAAELLVSSGSKSTSVFNFAAFLKADNDESDASTMFSDSDFSYVLKKLTKRDSNTKAKGLQEFSQLCIDKDMEVVVSVLPYWVPVYTKLSLDNDRRVRELCQECLGRLLGRVKKQLAPHLKSIMAVWLMSQCDVHAPASATLSKKVFQEAFNDAKQSEAVLFCKEDVFNYLKDNLFKMSVESIKESSLCDDEEVEGRYVRLLTSSIDALAMFFKLVGSKLKGELTDKIASLLVNPKFWKFPKNRSASVRRAFFDLISALCVKDFRDSISTYREQIVHSVLYNLDESDPYVVPALWRAAVSVVLNVENCWVHVNMRKGFLPKLFSVMEKGGSGCALVTHPNIIIILDSLPQEVKMGDGFSPLFLSKLRAGLENSQVQMSPRDVDAVLCSFVECCKYFIFCFIEKSQLPNIQAASLVVREQLLVTFKDVVIHSKRTLLDSKFFNLFADLVWYFRKMSLKTNITKMENVSNETKCINKIDKASHSLWKHVFKTCLDELCLLLTSLLEEESTIYVSNVDKITKFLSALFNILVDLPSPLTSECGLSSRKLKKRVSFDMPDGESSSKKSFVDDHQKEAQRIYQEDETFRDFINSLALLVFKKTNVASPTSQHIRLFKMLFVTFASEQFIGILTDGKTSECDFVKDVICAWMTSIDVSMLSDIIEMFLVAIGYLSESDKSLLIEFALQQLELSGTDHSDSRTSKFLLLTIRSKNSSLMIIRGVRCQELLVQSVLRSVNWFVENGTTSDDVWSLISTILLESMKKDDSSMLEVRNMMLTSIQNHLLQFLSQNQVNPAFDFVQMLFTGLSQGKCLAIVSQCDTLDWFFGLLLFASVRAPTDISVDVCDRSRSVLLCVLEFTENGVSSVDEFRCFQKIRAFFMKYIWCYAESFKCLKESVETSIKILEIVRKHFRDFDILEDFCNYRKVNFSDKESCKSLLKDPILMKKSLFEFDGEAEGEGEQSSIKRQIIHWIFTAKLLGRFTASQSGAALQVARMSASSADHDNCETYDLMSQRSKENQTIDRILLKRDCIVDHVMNTCSCLANLSLCSELYDETCSVELASDLNGSLDEFVKQYVDFEIAKLCVFRSIRSCLTNDKPVEYYKVQSCYRLKDDEDREYEKDSLALFNLLSKISKCAYFSDLRNDEEVADMTIKVDDVKKEVALVTLRILVHFSFQKLSKRLFRHLKLQVANYELTCHDGTGMIVNFWPQLNFWTALDIILSREEFDDFFAENKDTINDKTHEDTVHEGVSCVQLVPLESAVSGAACNVEESELADSLGQLIKKIIELKDFYANLKKDLDYSDLNGVHVEVLSFFKNFVMRFGKMPHLAVEHWDVIICYLVSQLEVFSENFLISHESFSQNFSSAQPFLKAVSRLVIRLCKFFSSQDIPEEFCQLVDEWSNLFCPSIFEHMCQIFIGAIKEQKLHETEFDEVATLLCEVMTYCPSTCMSSLFSKTSSSSSQIRTDEEEEEAERLFELISPLLSFPSRYVQVTAHLLLKKVVPMKIECLKTKYEEEFSALLETQQQQQAQEDTDNNEATPASTYLPTLINSFTQASETLMNTTTFPIKLFDDVAISPSNYSALLSYVLNFDLILDSYAAAPACVKSALLHWFKSCVVERHLSLLLSILQRTPSVSLQQTAHESLTMPVRTGANITVSCKEVISSMDCVYLSNNVLLSKTLFKQSGILNGAEFESFVGELKEVAFKLYVRTVHAFPRIVRTWFSNLDQKSAILVDKFTSKYISPGFISKELASVQCTASLDQLGANLQVKTRPILKEITALYSLDDVAIELSINFPDNSPLTSLKISLDHNKITSVKQNCSNWLLQLVKILNYKDGSLLDALSLWRKNLDRHFDGNSCMICFSLILNHQGSKILPKLQCKTCKKRFHNVCLYTWFKTSHNAACPLCRSVF